MSTSSFIQMTLIEESQNSKEVTANDALIKLEAKLCDQLTVAMGDANQTLTDDQANKYRVYKCTGAMTAQRNFVVPARKLPFVVLNSTTGGFGIQVKTSAGTGVVVAAGDAGNCYCDGTNVISTGSSASGVTSVFTRTGAVTAQTGDYTAAQVTNALDTSTTRTANTVYSGPTSGGAAAPTFRALVANDIPTMVGDSGSGGTKGAVPAPGAGDAAAGKFLKADGTFAVPSGTGMTNPMTTAGDIIYGGSSGTPTRLAAGSEDSVLSIQSGNPAWRRKGQVDVNTESTTSRTLALTDAGSIVRCTNGSATNVTVPPNSSVAFSVGDTIGVRQGGAGQVTLVQGSGVTINAPYGGTLVMAGQGAFVQLVKVATDTWDLIGQVVSA